MASLPEPNAGVTQRPESEQDKSTPQVFSNEYGFSFSTSADFDKQQAGFVKTSEAISSPNLHRCQLFDIPSLLYDQKWLGADQARVELVCHTDSHVEDAISKFIKAFSQSAFEVHIEPEGKMGALTVRAVKIEHNVQPGPILQLLPLCLWVEPNKLAGAAAEEKAQLLADPKEISDAITQELQQLVIDQKLILNNLQGLKAYNPNIPHTKGSVTWAELDKTKKNLTALQKEKAITQCLRCSFCRRIIRLTVEDLVARSAGVTAANAPKLAAIESKIQEAKGKNNKQRRKRLQRKKKQKAQGPTTSDASAAAPANASASPFGASTPAAPSKPH